MAATRDGVYHNLKESEYTASCEGVVFFFSRKLYQAKFLEKYEENRKKFYKSLKRFANETMYNFDMFIDLHFYKEVEKNGFYVEFKGGEMSCLEIETMILRNLTKTNTNVWSGT
ncbi:transcriptional activator [Bacillus phage vB_Bpu_PumA2]|uniref:Transcriptional activator n=1 Tax=Bacillus phage vB_Bpu_PumA2 TaxID=2662128 RepID=A0A5Q2WDA8_9CAUD|nr:late transcriptional activator [Bacillus phage vB_Bpu_PumA2]QGH74230.1 transcriptional activator [Bacillus phage vB_Bpu_PumA2]